MSDRTGSSKPTASADPARARARARARVQSSRVYVIAAVVIGFFILGLGAMLLTGYLSGGNPRTAPAPTSYGAPVAALVGSTTS